jgi:hypothetical protein
MNLSAKQRQLLTAMQLTPGRWYTLKDLTKSGLALSRDIEPLEHDRLIQRRSINGASHWGLTTAGRNAEV